jgi:hypothetical protein
MSEPTSIERGKLAYFALDLPHKGQASWVHIHEIVDNLRGLGSHRGRERPASRATSSPRLTSTCVRPGRR